MRKIIFVFLSLLILGACEKKDPVDQSRIDDEIIQEYIQKHNLDVTKDESGLYYLITKEGSGNHPTIQSYVTLNYKGYLTDGTVFDQTTEAVSFYLSSLIEGWQIAVPKLKSGGKGLFLIPSALGYGSRGSGSIPGNAVLIFEIELITFEN
jgi:FKBP-type peptidyl-prolyl cis-trans isomerase FkpA